MVTDDAVDDAFSMLLQSGFKQCATYESCTWRTLAAARKPYAPSTKAHVHINEHLLIGIFKKSDTLWRLSSLRPDMNETSAASDVISASDPSLPGPSISHGRGALSPLLPHPVHIPSIQRLTEAFILLSVRHTPSLLGYFWQSMICYLAQYVTKDGLLDHDLLQPHHKRFIEYMEKRRLGRSLKS